VKGKSILESKTIEKIWPSIPQKLRARWEEVYSTFYSSKRVYMKCRKRINALRKHSRINEEFLVAYASAKEELIRLKREFESHRRTLNKLSLKLFSNVPVEMCDRESKAPVQEKLILEPFTVVLCREEVRRLAEHLLTCLSKWPRDVNRVALEFDENVAYKTHAVKESADDEKKTFVTSKRGN
jgi:hypothetical protein